MIKLIVLSLMVGCIACIPAFKNLSVTPDGAHYLATATNLANGTGYTTGLDMPATSWVPAYPAVLACIISFVRNAVVAATMLNVLAVAAVYLLAWLILREWRDKTDWLTWCGAAVVALSPGIVTSATFALAETMFTPLVLLMIYAAMRVEHSRKWLWGLAVTGVAVALTRHIGILVIAAVAIAWRERRYWLACLPGVVAIGLWLWLFGTGAQMARPDLPHGFRGLWVSLVGIHTQLGGWPIVGLLIAAFVLWWRRSKKPPAVITAGLSLLLLTALLGFFAVVGDLGGRMQLAAHALLILCLVVTIDEILAEHPIRWGLYAGIAMMSLVTLVRVFFTPPTVLAANFNLPIWRNSFAMQFIKNLPPDVDVYSNAQDGIWFATGRVTYAMPRTDGRLVPAPHEDKGGVLVYFKTLGRTYYVPPQTYLNRITRNKLGEPIVRENRLLFLAAIGPPK